MAKIVFEAAIWTNIDIRDKNIVIKNDNSEIKVNEIALEICVIQIVIRPAIGNNIDIKVENNDIIKTNIS